MNEEKTKKSKDEIDEYINSLDDKITDAVNKISKKRKKKTELRKIKKSVTIGEILTEEESRHLLEVCNNSEHPLENKILVMTMMIIGFRIGEVTHLKKRWVDFKKQTITIPAHEPCDCNYCFGRIMEQLYTISKNKGEKQDKENKDKQKLIAKQKVKEFYWQPKTPAGVRVVYYGFDPEYETVLKEFFSQYNSWPLSYAAAYSRLRKMLNLADLKDKKDHHLRKTAGSNYAARNFTEAQQMDVMGWDDANVARVYIRLFGPRSVEAQKKALGDGKEKGYIHDSRITFYITDFGRQLLTRGKKRDEQKWLKDVLFPKNGSKTQKNKNKTFLDFID
jgi:integrase